MIRRFQSHIVTDDPIPNYRDEKRSTLWRGSFLYLDGGERIFLCEDMLLLFEIAVFLAEKTGGFVEVQVVLSGIDDTVHDVRAVVGNAL